MRIKAGIKRLTLLLLTVFTLTLGSAGLLQETYASTNGGAAVSAGQFRIRIGRQRDYRYRHNRYHRWHRYHRWDEDRPYRP